MLHPQDWTIERALQLYNIPNWGAGYFNINSKGHLVVHPNGQPGPVIDLMEERADVAIRAQFTADYDRIRPEPQPGIHLNNTLNVTLSGVNTVTESNTRQAGKLSDNQSGMKILGQQSSDGGSSWKVAGPNRLERVISHPHSVTSMTIEVSPHTRDSP